jgi:TonB family protein
MTRSSFLSRLSRFPIPLFATLMSFALIWSCLSCQNNMHSKTKIHDTAKVDDPAKVTAPIDIPVDQKIPIGEITAPQNATRPISMISLIHNAADDGDLQKVKALLKDNPNLVSSKDSYDGSTPLHLAANKGHREVAEMLLAHDAMVDAGNNCGQTPLYLAVAGNHKDIIELLLSNGAQVNAKNISGYTLVHIAAREGYKEAAEMLLAHDAIVDAKDNISETPLHVAVATNHKDIIKLLLDKGAQVNAQNVFGETPLDIAEFIGHKDVMGLLRQRGGTNGTGRGTGIRDGVRLYVIGNVTEPVPLIHPQPPYTEEARKARIEGIAVLQATIRANGTIDSFRVIKGPGYGLEDSAINTIASKWRFKPGTMKGVPVDATSYIEVLFRIF